jgi:hypothetical protein
MGRLASGRTARFFRGEDSEMIERFDIYGKKERHENGNHVDYEDHASEMKEVLRAGRMLYLYADSEKRGEWLPVIDKYRHYLETK